MYLSLLGIGQLGKRLRLSSHHHLEPPTTRVHRDDWYLWNCTVSEKVRVLRGEHAASYEDHFRSEGFQFYPQMASADQRAAKRVATSTARGNRSQLADPSSGDRPSTRNLKSKQTCCSAQTEMVCSTSRSAGYKSDGCVVSHLCSKSMYSGSSPNKRFPSLS